VWYSVVFPKLCHIAITSTLFAFQNLLRRCASRPVMHERFSGACPVLILQAGRAAKWQLQMSSKAAALPRPGCSAQARSPGQMEPREEQSWLPLQAGTGQGSPREPGHECCLGGARAAGKKVAEGAQRCPGKGLCSVLQRKAKNPQGHSLAHHGGKKNPSSPQLQGTRGHPGGAREPGSNLAQRDKRSRDKRSCSMLQRKAKNPRGPVPMGPGGKFLPDPSAGDRLFPEHGSKTGLLVPQAGHASQEVSKPYCPSS